MELWMKIGSALLLGTMLVMLLPRARQMFAESRPAAAGDWRAFLLPAAAVAGFVLLLMWLV